MARDGVSGLQSAMACYLKGVPLHGLAEHKDDKDKGIAVLSNAEACKLINNTKYELVKHNGLKTCLEVEGMRSHCQILFFSCTFSIPHSF